MSRYTTEVRFICESAAGLDSSKGFGDVEQILTTAAPLVFNFDFPIYDESYRLVLEKKILRHYYTREICAETVGLWKLWLCDKLNIIMPYYNKMYESTLLQFNPLYDVDVTTERDVENTGTSVGNTTNASTANEANRGTISDAGTNSSNSNDWKLFSDTPQGGITGVANASIIQDSSLTDYAYLTTAENDKHNGSGTDSNLRTLNTDNTTNLNATGTTSNAINNLEDYTERVFGKRGAHTYSAMLMEFRKSIINIDEMIIEELSDLFFKLWD